MLRVSVDKIEPGMVLARPICLPDEPGRYLLQRDVEIPPGVAQRLKRWGIVDVWIRYRQLEFLEEMIDEDLGDRQREVYRHVRKNFEQIMSGSTIELDLNRFSASIGELFGYLKRNPTGNLLLDKLDSFDNYLMSHSANVCYLALMLGMRLERYLIAERTFKTARDAKDLQLLGLGMLLHDVGKMRIPPAILNKPGKLTAEELEVIRTHPTVGYEMVRQAVPATASQVVLNHHQRWDGRGYPARRDARTGQTLPPLAGRQIPVFSRIATVVDVYDAATTNRCYSAAKPAVQVLHEMRTICRGFFDPVVEQAFYEIVPPFPIGKAVVLSNGAEAVVVDFNARFPVRPKVQLLRHPNGEKIADPAGEEIDLSIYPELNVASIDGVDVQPYLAGQQVGSSAEAALA
ncbi:MAG: HD-GYP domain-containing protein [Pirellulales bacterium]